LAVALVVLVFGGYAAVTISQSRWHRAKGLGWPQATGRRVADGLSFLWHLLF